MAWSSSQLFWWNRPVSINALCKIRNHLYLAIIRLGTLLLILKSCALQNAFKARHVTIIMHQSSKWNKRNKRLATGGKLISGKLWQLAESIYYMFWTALEGGRFGKGHVQAHRTHNCQVLRTSYRFWLNSASIRNAIVKDDACARMDEVVFTTQKERAIPQIMSTIINDSLEHGERPELHTIIWTLIQ